MKSRTSFFKNILRKDILRFAPLWFIYLIGGILVMLSVTDSVRAANSARSLALTIGPFSVINLIYAALAAQLLFGDLFNSRLCNALHAMPMRRETWFAGHVVSGLCYSAVPHIIGALVLITRLGGYWYIALIWLLGMTLEYLFFFGLAVFSVFCTGNRFAMAAVYAILNFLSLIAWWFVATIYEPVIYGVAIPSDPFIHLCPVVFLCGRENMVLFEGVWETGDYTWKYLGLGEGWGYLAVIAVIGGALLGDSLLMYRRRALERAGDFMAVKPLVPVFSVVYTLCVGAVFALFGDLISDGYLLFLIIGIAVGYFTGQMLLQRTIKVFKPGAFVKLALLAAVMLGSVFAVKADPFGVARWVPEKEQVTKVVVSNSNGFSAHLDSTLVLEDAEEIEKIIQVHESILDNRDLEKDNSVYVLAIRYYLVNGTRAERVYQTCLTDTAYQILLSLYNQPEHILGYTDWTKYLNMVETIYVDRGAVTDKGACRELLEAVKADCEAGNMVQYWAFRNETKTDYCLGINIQVRTGIDTVEQTWIDVYTDAENTVKWLKEHRNLWDPDNRYAFD
ncbi:MAG: hypothetical protein J6L24_00645 [Oscillospiraceae bacterium]|nr:hypothetical protein [Oscillospiraceae bacterium]